MKKELTLVRELKKMEQAFKELESKLAILNIMKQKAEQEQPYETAFECTVTTSMPLWVRDLFYERCKPEIDMHIEATRKRGIQIEGVSVSATLRYIVYWAIMNPDIIERVSLEDLWEMKKDLGVDCEQ